MTSDPSALADGLAAVSLDADAPIARVVPTRHPTVDESAPTLNLHAPADDLQSSVQAALDQVQERIVDSDPSQEQPKKARIRPTILLNAFELVEPREGRSGLRYAQVCKIGDLCGVTRLGARFEKLPPGSRTSYPHAHRLESELAFCISGSGIVWQNGYTYPFGPGDVASWKAGTGVAHTIINDSNRDGPDGGEELVLVTISDKQPGDSWYYPLSPERRAAIKPEQTWEEKDVPAQNEYGTHPGFPCVPYVTEESGRGDRSGQAAQYERPSDGPRPSNIVNAFEASEDVGEGEFTFHGCSLTAESGLRGTGFGCSFEVLPPGTRSSTPHCHKDEDEMILVLDGTGSLWLNGEIIPVGPGDCVGFPRGTGIAHNFINDSNADGAEGHNLALFIVGEHRPDTDKVCYPVNTEKKVTFPRWWDDAPEHKMGSHNGRPCRPKQ